MAVLRMHGLTSGQARVLAAIAYRDGRAGAFPTVARIGEDSGLATRTVREHLTALCKLGVLKRTRRQRANAYEITYGWKPSDLRKSAPPRPADTRTSEPPSDVRKSAARPADSRRQTCGSPPSDLRKSAPIRELTGFNGEEGRSAPSGGAERPSDSTGTLAPASAPPARAAPPEGASRPDGAHETQQRWCEVCDTPRPAHLNFATCARCGTVTRAITADERQNARSPPLSEAERAANRERIAETIRTSTAPDTPEHRAQAAADEHRQFEAERDAKVEAWRKELEQDEPP